MKRLFALIFSLLVLVLLVACNGSAVRNSGLTGGGGPVFHPGSTETDSTLLPSDTGMVTITDRDSTKGSSLMTEDPSVSESEPEEEVVYPLFDSNCVLGSQEASRLISWVKEGWKTRNAICKEFGSPKDYATGPRTTAYYVEDGRWVFLDHSGGDFYQVREDTPGFFPMADFVAAVKEDGRKEAFVARFGEPHSGMGYGIHRDVYYTSDGQKLSVLYSQGVVVELKQVVGNERISLYPKPAETP